MQNDAVYNATGHNSQSQELSILCSHTPPTHQLLLRASTDDICAFVVACANQFEVAFGMASDGAAMCKGSFESGGGYLASARTGLAATSSKSDSIMPHARLLTD